MEVVIAKAVASSRNFFNRALMIYGCWCLFIRDFFVDLQVPHGGSKKALTTLGEVLQRLLHFLSHADEAAPVLESRGSTPAPLRDPPSPVKTPASSKQHKPPPSGKSTSKKRPAGNEAGASTPAKRAALNAPPPSEVPQVCAGAFIIRQARIWKVC